MDPGDTVTIDLVESFSMHCTLQRQHPINVFQLCLKDIKDSSVHVCLKLSLSFS